MSKTLQSPRHEALRAFLLAQRKKRGLKQAEVAERMGTYQSFVSDVESGERRVDAVQLLDFAEAIGFKPAAALRAMRKAKR